MFTSRWGEILEAWACWREGSAEDRGAAPSGRRGRVGLRMVMGEGAHSRGSSLMGILFPPRLGRRGPAQGGCEGNRRCVGSWAGSPAGLMCCFSHRKESLYK